MTQAQHTPGPDNTANRVASNLAKLPDFCYTYLPSTKEPIRIFKGEDGYHPPAYADVDVDEINGLLGITHEQEQAMVMGSMCGWGTPGTDPEMWENHPKFQAKLKREGKRSGKEMRAAIAEAKGGMA